VDEECFCACPITPMKKYIFTSNRRNLYEFRFYTEIFVPPGAMGRLIRSEFQRSPLLSTILHRPDQMRQANNRLEIWTGKSQIRGKAQKRQSFTWECPTTVAGNSARFERKTCIYNGVEIWLEKSFWSLWEKHKSGKALPVTVSRGKSLASGGNTFIYN
jgi:hypothetical protein